MLLLVANGYTQGNSHVSQHAIIKDTVYVRKLIQNAGKAWEGNKEQALDICTEAYNLSLKMNYQMGCIKAILTRANLKRRIAMDESAVEDYKTVLAFSAKANRKDLMAEVYQALMETYLAMGRLDSALQVHKRLMKHLEQGGSKTVLFHAYYTLASFLHSQDSMLGRKYHFEALKIAREENDPKLLVEILTAISKFLHDAKPMAEVNHYANEAVLIAHRSKEEYLLGLAYNNKATLSAVFNQIDSSIFYGKKAYSISKDIKSINNRIISLVLIADGLNSLKDYKGRLYYLKEAYTLAKQHGSFRYMTIICRELAKTYNTLGQHDRAFEFLSMFVAQNDSLNSEQYIKAREEFGIKYKVVENEKQVAESKLKVREKEIQLKSSKQYTLYSICFALIAILVAIVFFLNYKSKRNLHRQQFQNLQQEKEIQLLQALMQGEEKERSRIAKDLHDGVAGMLAAAKMQLSSLSIKNRELVETTEFVHAVKLLDDSTQEVRRTSHNLMPEVLIRHGLDEALRRYCNNISNGNLLQVHYEAWGEIKRYMETFELSVYRIVQELLNNVVKHSKATEASVQLSVKEEALFIFIEDNGIGFQQPVQKEGMGLQSLQSRIKAMNGHFEVNDSGNSGVSAYLEFNTKGLEG